MSQDGSQRRVVVIGGGHGGGAVTAMLRQYGHTGPITIIGTETTPPYERPPLSKQWLKDDVDSAAALLRPADFYVDQNVSLRLGTTVTELDAVARRVTLHDGDVIDYDVAVIATGAMPRNLLMVGTRARNVHVLRDQADSRQLRETLRTAKRIAICGGGFIGLEVAATARHLGVEVTVIDQSPRVLSRVVSEPLSEFVRRYHESSGVDFVLDAVIGPLTTQGDTVRQVDLGDGRTIECDAVVVGIGAEPNTAIAVQAGLRCDRGIVVDADARTSDSHIFAIGDVSVRPVGINGDRCRLESVPSTLEQAKQAASAIVGRARPAGEVPWFWSDQGELKIQIAGLYTPDALTVVRDTGESGFTAVHLARDGSVVAVETVNRPGDFMVGKKLINSRSLIGEAQLQDSTLALKEIAKLTSSKVS